MKSSHAAESESQITRVMCTERRKEHTGWCYQSSIESIAEWVCFAFALSRASVSCGRSCGSVVIKHQLLSSNSLHFLSLVLVVPIRTSSASLLSFHSVHQPQHAAIAQS
jgi:hypothetical protein